jgi:hypothetical protein
MGCQAGPCQDGSEPALPDADDEATTWNPIALQYGLTTQSLTSM